MHKISLFSFPRIIRWIFLLFLFFILVMSIFRIIFFFRFHPTDISLNESLSSFWLGIRYDARIAAIILFPLLIIGSLSIKNRKGSPRKRKLFAVAVCLIPALAIILPKTDFSQPEKIIQKLVIGLAVSGFLALIIILKEWNPFNSARAKKFWLWYLGIASLVIVFFYGFDYYYYSYLTQRLNSNILNFLDDAGISFNMMWQSYPLVKILLVLIIFLIVFLWIIKRLYAAATIPNSISKISRIISFIIAFLFFGLCIYGKPERFPLRWSDAFTLGNNYKANLALNPFQSFFSSLNFRHAEYDIEKVKEYYPMMAQYLQIKNPDINRLNFKRVYSGSKDSIIEKPNVIIVLCESFSAYKSSMWNNPLRTTTFFESLARKGLFFDRCFTPHFGTARGVWATITGVPDVQLVKTASRNPRAVDQHTIINAFEGYEKFYFLGGSASWANIRGVLTNNISDLKLYEEDDYSTPRIDVWGISDMNLFLEANKILAKREKPFFAIIQTSDNHRPYTIPQEDIGEFKKISGIPADTLKKYGFESIEEFNAFRYTDFCFQKFMEAAQKEKYMENTLFVFVGDHGIRSKYSLPMFPKAWVDQGLACEHVPLLFYYPKVLKAQRVSAICSQVDILPTIAGIFNIPHINSGMGRNLYDNLNADNYAFIIDHDTRQIGMVHNNYYFTRYLSSSKEEFVSIANDEPVHSDPLTDSMRSNMSAMTQAFYETARYLLLNNQKTGNK